MKFGICNEIFQGWKIEDTAEFAARAGYDALEIAPFTITPYVTDIPLAARQRVRQAAARAGVAISGIHWVLARTEGLHLIHPDPAIRARTSNYLCDLVDSAPTLEARSWFSARPNNGARSKELPRGRRGIGRRKRCGRPWPARRIAV